MPPHFPKEPYASPIGPTFIDVVFRIHICIIFHIDFPPAVGLLGQNILGINEAKNSQK